LLSLRMGGLSLCIDGIALRMLLWFAAAGRRLSACVRNHCKRWKWQWQWEGVVGRRVELELRYWWGQWWRFCSFCFCFCFWFYCN